MTSQVKDALETWAIDAPPHGLNLTCHCIIAANLLEGIPTMSICDGVAASHTSSNCQIAADVAEWRTSAIDAVDGSSTGIQRPHSGIDSWTVYDRLWHKADI
jgi:hypothetical protein